MKFLAVAVVAAVAFVSADASALEDCNQYSATSQLEKRLDCLQRNNNELLQLIQALQNANFVSYGDELQIWNQSVPDVICLGADNHSATFPTCSTSQNGQRLHLKRWQ